MNKDFKNLNLQYNKYVYPKPIENIENELHTSVSLIGTGPEVYDTIDRRL